MKKVRTYLVNEVARLADISVRTLHHYDEMGLLTPASRTAAGYRVYDDDGLLRLQQILIHRELGYSLEEIRRLLDDPAFDRKEALLAQRKQLCERARTTTEMIAAIDKAISVLDRQPTREAIDMKEIFEGFDPAKYEAEAKHRWGHTDAYKQSMQRSQGYTAEDWKNLKDEQDAIYRAAAEALRAGRSPDSAEAMDIAERHRLGIDRWFYACSFAMHCGLADMYEADGRFAATIDSYGEGLTPFLVSAIRANARRAGR